MSKLKSVNGHIIVRFLEEEDEKLQGNIILPHLEQVEIMPAEVISVSPQYNFNTDNWVDSWVKEGDIIFMSKMGGQRIFYENEELIITRIESIMAIAKN